MGKVASPGENYCGVFPSGSLSVGGTIFTTENPPISYSISGTTVTVSDATAVIGAADISGSLVREDTVPASPSTDYCGGKPKAKLRWSEGSIETTNTPISYTLTPAVPDQWDYVFFGIRSFSGCVTGYSVIYREEVDVTPVVALDFRSGATGTCALPIKDVRAKVSFDGGSSFKTMLQSRQSTPTTSIFYPSGYPIDWHGNTVSDALPTLYSKTFVPGTPWILEVSDSTGVIATYEHETEPTNFSVTCYDYDLREVNYACSGECPGGTEFQCKCTADNMLYCYGFSDPDTFEVLFSSPITA